MVTVAEYAFQIASLSISVAALVYAALAFRAAKLAIDVSQSSTVTELRLRVQEAIAEVERSFFALQSACQVTREQWEQRLSGGFPSFRVSSKEPSEIQRIIDLEYAGRKLVFGLKEAAPAEGATNALELESFVGRAKSLSVQIERLRLQLEAPRPFPR